MSDEQVQQRKTPTAKDIWRLVLVIVTIVAIVQELRKAPDVRTWQGTVAGFFPYDLRKPTKERFVEAYWNPEGPAIGRKPWGAGWAINFGAATRLMGADRPV
jgi:hypothetical protein